MNSKFSVPLLAAIALLTAIFIFRNSIPDLAERESNKISGAFEALGQMSMARVYPFKQLPPEGLLRAWRFVSEMMPAETAVRSTDPWQTLGPHNRAGRTLRLAFNPLNPNTMYAGSASGGLWRSYTGGQGGNAWHQVPTGFPVSAVGTIAFLPNDSMTIFIGTGEVYNHLAAGTGGIYRPNRGTYGIGILRSKDGGDTWEKSLDFTQDQNKGVWDIEVAPSDPSIVYAATTDGVYKSMDGGDNWNLVHNVVLANDLAVHPMDPNKVVVGSGNQSSPGHGIYRTQNGGDTWTKSTLDSAEFANGKIQLDYAKSSPDILFASIGNGLSWSDGASWLYRSNDFGATWTLRTQQDYSRHQGWFSHDVAVHPTNPNELVVVGIEVWRSSNGGTTLQLKGVSSNGGIGFENPPIEGPDGGPEFVHSDVHDAIWHPTLPNVFYVASDGGVHRSEDSGQSFRSASGRMQTAQFYNGFSCSATDEFFCMGGLQDNGTIRLNANIDPVTGSPVTWQRKYGADGSWTAINQQNDQYSYLSYQYLTMFYSQDGGNYYNYSGTPAQEPIAFIAPFAAAPSNGSVLYAGSAIVAKSTDHGNTWQTTNNGQLLDGGPVNSMAISYQTPDVAYVTTAPYDGNPGNVFVTRNGGDTWEPITDGLPDRFFMDLEVDPTNDSVAFVAVGGYGTSHLFRTKNYGATWEDIGVGLPDLPTNAIAVDPLFPTNIYIGNDLGVFSSVDNGATWQSYLEGLPEAVIVFDLKISAANRKLRVATHGNGAYQRDLLETPYVSSASETDKPIFNLKIYPNPASQQATLTYQLVDKQLVTIELLDSQGKLFQTLLWKDSQLRGNHRLQLPAAELPSGIYYCRLRAGDNIGLQKLVISR